MFLFVVLKFPDVTDIQCILWWMLFLQIQTLSPKRVMFALCNSVRKFNLTCHAYSNVHCISNTLLRSIKERENAMLYILYPIIVPFILWYGLVLIKLLKLCPKIRILRFQIKKFYFSTLTKKVNIDKVGINNFLFKKIHVIVLENQYTKSSLIF